MKTCCSISKTKYFSWKSGNIAKGCELCVKGQKLVLFITGLCGQRCFYCPVSEKKFGNDVVFANEWKITRPDNPVELFEEARLTKATGAGITGGDPLAKVDRCCKYIKLLKKEFGKIFHIHLYTPLMLVDDERLKKLAEAGLNEIRFHPDLDDKTLWPRIELAKKYGWDVGVEIPAVPGYEAKTRELIDFIAGKISFLNLNELELSDTQARHYKLDNFTAKNSLSYGVKGSQQVALKMMKYASQKGLRSHFCTARLKDFVQVGERIKRRAENVARPDEKITFEGTIIRGCIYLQETKPSFGYRKHLQEVDRQQLVAKLDKMRKRLLEEKIFSIGEIIVDDKKFRLIVNSKNVKKLAGKIKKLDLCPAVVEEYPTADALEVDLQFV